MTSPAKPTTVTPASPARPPGPVVLDEALVLRQGAELVARVVSAPARGGRGTLSLAGLIVRAQLPEGLAAGQRLPLVVVGEDAGRVVLRIRRDGSGAEDASRLAAALALAGDGELLRAALGLAGPPAVVELPGGVLAALRSGDEESHGASPGESGGDVGFVLHSQVLGPIGVRVALRNGMVTALVTVEPGEAAADARDGARELAVSLERATGSAAAVEVVERGAGAPRPPAPRPPGGIRVWA
jgi:hypothetical protein